MAVDVLSETVIDLPCPEVASYAADPVHAPDWYENISTAAWQGEPTLRIGAEMAFTAHFLGRRLSYTYEVTAYEPDRRLVMRTAQGPFPMETTYTWEPHGDAGDRTRMTLRNHGEPAGVLSVAAPLITAAVRRANRRDLARLKSLLEQRGT